jgi:Protein of unknown function (DUF402)
LGEGAYRWQRGEQIVRRELCLGRPWLGQAAIVVDDTDGLLALFVAAGSQLAYPDGDWPGGRHPWFGKERWRGHGVLQLQRPGEAHAVWLFWTGPERRLDFWYVNLQAPFRRTSVGIDTQDHELDIVIQPDGSWRFKDEEWLGEWVRLGRWTDAEVAAIRAEGARIAAALDAGERWWSDDWARWEPEPAWRGGDLPSGWEAA